jgi:hypothetical protein
MRGEHWEFHEPVFLDLNPKRGKDGFDRGIPIDGCVVCRNDLLVGLPCIAVEVENERAKRDAMVLEGNSNAITQHKIALLSPIRRGPGHTTPRPRVPEIETDGWRGMKTPQGPGYAEPMRQAARGPFETLTSGGYSMNSI